MRIACLLIVGACSFPHGKLPGGDGSDDASIDAVDAPPGAITSPRKLTIDNSTSTVDFAGHPVLVVLDATKIDYSQVLTPNTDLRFEYATDGNMAEIGDNVPFEVEKWDTTGESFVWIRVPEILLGTTNTAVLMHFGSAAAGQASAQQTFMNWRLVNHMATGLTNAAGSFGTSTQNISSMPGQIGDAAAFNGNDSRLVWSNSGALFDGWSAFTLSFWLYLDYENVAAITGEPRVMDKGTSLTLGRLIPQANNTEVVFQIDLHFSGSNDVYASTPIPLETWTFVTVVFDGYGVGISRNGESDGYLDLTGNQQTMLGASQQFFVGNTTNAFKGRIDELRIEDRTRQLDYIRAQYRHMTRQSVAFSAP